MAILDLPGHRSLRSWRAPEPENTPDCDPVRIRTLRAPTSVAADPLWLLGYSCLLPRRFHSQASDIEAGPFDVRRRKGEVQALGNGRENGGAPWRCSGSGRAAALVGGSVGLGCLCVRIAPTVGCSSRLVTRRTRVRCSAGSDPGDGLRLILGKDGGRVCN
jgi:hypothetical protein